MRRIEQTGARLVERARERAAQIAGRRAAAEYLRQLLLKPGQYREAWQHHVAKPRDDVINQMAVAEVVASRYSCTGSPGDTQ